jgi:DUF438 domain-containing protein
MQLSPNTSIADLLKSYPFMVDFLAAYNPKFKLLKNRVMRATMGKVATLKQIASIGEVSLDVLIKDITDEIKNRTGESTGIGTVVKSTSLPDNEKILKLKEIITDLHQDAPFEEVKERFDKLIDGIEPTEIAAMEEQLIREGMPIEEVRRLSELHVGIFKDALDAKDIPDTPLGHPVHTFIEENKAFTSTVGDMDLLYHQLQVDGTLLKLSELKQPLQKVLDTLAKVEIHYQRKENQLFPFLEKHGFTGPPKVMWGVHDDIRAQLKALRKAIKGQDIKALLVKGKALAQAIVDMVYKENHILFPLALQSLHESEWIEIRKGEGDIGYAFTKPAVDWPEAAAVSEAVADTDKAEKDSDWLDFDTGQMTLDQVNLLLKNLPMDLTFVDENDRVQYFSAGKERVFPRSPGIIGRSVQNCHPPKSLDTVNRIVGDLKDGTKDEASFWIQRDDEGSYRGTLEVTQDITDIKSIEGERRLLNWDSE